jgi:hypothetical protein
LALMALFVRPEPAGAFYTAMSFDDVARRMQQRDSTHPLTGVGPASAPLPTVDQYYVEMAVAERRSRKQKDIVLGSILLGVGLDHGGHLWQCIAVRGHLLHRVWPDDRGCDPTVPRSRGLTLGDSTLDTFGARR